MNDPLGNYSLTLIDSLSTLAILAGAPQEDGSLTGPQALSDFQNGIQSFVEYYGDGRPGPSGRGKRARGFDLDSKVQVFETVIRGVGGLLSAHLFATGELPIDGYKPQPVEGHVSDDPLELPPIKWPGGMKYDGQLLRLAMDLGQRLLPAFYTSTGIPYPRVNLRHGIPFYTNSPLHGFNDEDEDEAELREITETCSAGAGSLTLEFTVLSRLTGDPRFEQAAKRAFWEVWGRRSEIGLIGNGIDAERGVWIGTHSGIGAGMDSFFEYALKSHILLSGQDMPNTTLPLRHSDDEWLDPNSIHPPLPTELHSSDAFLEAWHLAHASVKQYIYTDRGHYPYYANNHRSTGQPYTMWIDSLGAFYPGLLALAGEIDEAIEANLVYTALWTRYSALPERWSFRDNNVDSGLGWWPGRPEFIESTYYIYRATRDPWYLYVGEMVLRDITMRCKAPCGWAGLQNVITGEKMDRMESFFLGETTKYMYLLFDPAHQLNKLDAPFVFSTEGHPLIIPKKGRIAPRPKPTSKEAAPFRYFDESFTNSCPAYPDAPPFSGSATAARPELFSVSRFTGLYQAPNFRGPLAPLEIEDRTRGTVHLMVPTSNHTLFPWTLPPTLLPDNGTCAAPPERVTSWIEFPALDGINSVVTRFNNFLRWFDYRGPTVRNLEGLRLQLEREESGDGGFVWRIVQAALTLLGKHETVFFYAEHVKHMKDEAFTTLRRQDVVEIQLYVDIENVNPPAASDGDDAGADEADERGSLKHKPAENASMSLPFETLGAQSLQAAEQDKEGEKKRKQQQQQKRLGKGAKYSPPSDDTPAPAPQESLLKSLLRAVTSAFEPSTTPSPSDARGPNSPLALVHSFDAYTPVGPGAFPVPSIPDTPVINGPGHDAKRPLSAFPWRTIYLAGYACDGILPAHSSRDHHVIVMRRGRCSFSDKLERIPSFPALSPSSLQIVVVVDEEEDDGSAEDGPDADEGPIRPLLERPQTMQSGAKRLNGVPLVLLSGTGGDYELFGRASGVGMRRKYIVKSQGFVIQNAMVI